MGVVVVLQRKTRSKKSSRQTLSDSFLKTSLNKTIRKNFLPCRFLVA